MLHAVPNRVARWNYIRRRYGLGPILRGLTLRHHFNKRHAVLWAGGRPRPRIQNHGLIETEVCTLWSGVRLEVGEGATLSIGNGTYLNRDTTVVCHNNVWIGDDCKISYQVIIMDTDEHLVPGAKTFTAPVVLENNVWLGARCIVLKGVRIGEGAVVGAGSIVTRDIPPRAIAAGQPARVIRFY
jgi:acetyltransferase-like isoleucine patch superfamily enzyme